MSDLHAISATEHYRYAIRGYILIGFKLLDDNQVHQFPPSLFCRNVRHNQYFGEPNGEGNTIEWY